MKTLFKKVLRIAGFAITVASAVAHAAYDPDYYLNEYYWTGGTKQFGLHWEGAAANETCSIDNDGFGDNRTFKITLRKQNIGDGSSIVGLADNLGVDQFSAFLTLTHFDFIGLPPATSNRKNYLPMVVGQDYQVEVEYKCLGISTIKSFGVKEFTYDVHNTMLTYPVYNQTHTRRIYNKAANQCLTPDTSTGDPFFTMVDSDHCNINNPELAFEIVDAGTGNPREVKLRSQRLNQCLQPVYANQNGSAVRAGACLDDLKTTFIIDVLKPGWDTKNVPAQIRFRHKKGGKCLYLYAETGNAHIWTCYTTPTPEKIFELRKYLVE